VDIFHTYVKPTVNPKLTDFCTKLTGITQRQVDEGVSLETALEQLHKLLRDKAIFNSEFIFMSCGDFDAKALMREA
jgi:inhibitor of KinA sporulation pathway (predicted exonuclease)